MVASHFFDPGVVVVALLKESKVAISLAVSSKLKTSRFSAEYAGAVVALLPVPAAITAPFCRTKRMHTCDAVLLCAVAIAASLGTYNSCCSIK